MDISWSAIAKILLTGIFTYVLFPGLLILRDYILWKFINAYILNKKLHEEIRAYATRINIWNNTFAQHKIGMDSIDGKTTYLIDGKEVTLSQWNEHRDSRDKLDMFINDNRLFIQRKSNFLKWLLKHYKQDSTNPIDEWLASDIERMKDSETK